MFFCSFKQDEKSTADAEQVDEEDAWVVENHHIQDWDPVSIHTCISKHSGQNTLTNGTMIEIAYGPT